MPLDPRVRRFLRFLEASNARSTEELTIAERRSSVEGLMRFGSAKPASVGIEESTIPGSDSPLRVRIYSPGGATPLLPGLVYFHGGGFVAGTLESHDGIARSLAHAGHCRVVSVDYRLAPEHPFPAGLDDALAAVTQVAGDAATFGIDAARVGVCGDSAGATLAASVCQTLARAGDIDIAVQLLLCPILDYSRATPSRREFAQGYLVDEATLAHDLLYYLPAGVDAADPRVSPGRLANLPRLPRTLIHSAECDPLRDEAHDYVERLRATGTSVSYTCHPGMIHLFYGLGDVIPYARTAFEIMGVELRAALASPVPHS